MINNAGQQSSVGKFKCRPHQWIYDKHIYRACTPVLERTGLDWSFHPLTRYGTHLRMGRSIPPTYMCTMAKAQMVILAHMINGRQVLTIQNKLHSQSQWYTVHSDDCQTSRPMNIEGVLVIHLDGPKVGPWGSVYVFTYYCVIWEMLCEK